MAKDPAVVICSACGCGVIKKVAIKYEDEYFCDEECRLDRLGS